MMIQKLVTRVLLVFAMTAPLAARAQYYTSGDAYRCQRGVSTGVAAGGLFGFFAGMALGNGRAGPAIGGLAAGAVAGGLLGAGMSCQQEGAYIGRYDQFLSRPGMCGANYLCQDGNTSFMLLRAGYDQWRNPCRMYHYEIRTPDGRWVGRNQTACYINGMWRHGYESNVIMGGWMRPQMSIVEMRRFPVLYQAYQRYPQYGQNYWPQYWARPVPRPMMMSGGRPGVLPMPQQGAPTVRPAVF